MTTPIWIFHQIGEEQIKAMPEDKMDSPVNRPASPEEERGTGQTTWGPLDHRGAFDAVWVANAFVHVERMSDTCFWMRFDTQQGPGIAIRTGIHRGKWFFRIEEDKIGGREYVVERPRTKKTLTVRSPEPQQASRDGAQGQK